MTRHVTDILQSNKYIAITAPKIEIELSINSDILN